jgi:hypothetical protein
MHSLIRDKNPIFLGLMIWHIPGKELGNPHGILRPRYLMLWLIEKQFEDETRGAH